MLCWSKHRSKTKPATGSSNGGLPNASNFANSTTLVASSWHYCCRYLADGFTTVANLMYVSALSVWHHDDKVKISCFHVWQRHPLFRTVTVYFQKESITVSPAPFLRRAMIECWTDYDLIELQNDDKLSNDTKCRVSAALREGSAPKFDELVRKKDQIRQNNWFHDDYLFNKWTENDLNIFL